MNPARVPHIAKFRGCVTMSSLVMAVVLLAACAKGPTRVRVLVKGSAIHGANGIMFDKQDRLHIASVWGNEIVVMDPKTGRILQRLGSDKGVYTPDDIAFGPDGSLYWTSILTGAVGRLSPDGSTKTQAVAPGVNPITFSAGGRLFVGLCFLGDGIFELDPALVLPPIPKPKEPGMLNGFDFGPDGLLYSPLFFDGRVVRMNVDSVPVKYETVAVGFATPAAVKFDPHGRLHGHSQVTGELWRLDPSTGSKVTIATLPPGTDNLAFDSRGRLFVSHAQDGSIFEILPGGEPRKMSEGGMILPGGVAVLAGPQFGESVFVADFFSLRAFNGLTGQPKSVARYFFDPTGITAPMTVSTDGGNLVLSSWVGRSVQVWNPETRRVLENHTDFAVPVNAIRFQGDLVVAELETHSVVRVTSKGRVKLTDALVVPAGLAATAGDLWVSDRSAGTVWRIASGGVGLPSPVRVAARLHSPEGLAVDYDGSLLVVESGIGRLSRINVSTGQVATVADGLELGAAASPGMPPTWAFNGVAVGPSRAIYVTGDKASVLYRLRFPH
jgi:sugar lactone lactonase YvrE